MDIKDLRRVELLIEHRLWEKVTHWVEHKDSPMPIYLQLETVENIIKSIGDREYKDLKLSTEYAAIEGAYLTNITYLIRKRIEE